MILFCSISCNDLNGSVDGDCADDGDDSFGFNNVLLLVIQNKI
jgi:hypothetical protein